MKFHKYLLSSSIFFAAVIFLSFITAPVGHVNDHANLFSKEYVQSLEKGLQKFKKENGYEIAVLTVKDLDSLSVEEYAQDVFDSWAIGDKKEDSGVLLLVSLKDRKIRIHTGYGVEGDLPDGVCGRIIRETISPLYKKGKYEAGTTNGIKKVARHLTKKEVIHPATNYDPITLSIFIAFMTIWVIARIFRGRITKRFPFMYWFLYDWTRSRSYTWSKEKGWVEDKTHHSTGGWGRGSPGGFDGFGGGSSGGGGASGGF